MAEINTNRKNPLINFLRGTAVFLMLWGHCIQYCSGGQFDYFENAVFKTIYAFHMPFFMLISGYLFYYSERKRGLTELIEYKTKSLLYPILMCSILNHLITKGVWSVLHRGGEVGDPPLDSLWFLWSVLAAGVAVALAVKITNKPALQALLLIAGIACVAVFPRRTSNVFVYPYFVIGYLYSRNEEKLKKYFKYFGAASLALFVAMLFFYEKKHYIYQSGLFGGESVIDSIKIDCFRWGIGLFGSVAAAWILKLIYKAAHGKLTKGIESLGQDSLAVYALSTALLTFWLPILVRKVLPLTTINWNAHILVYDFLVTTAVAAFYSVVLILLIRLMKKLKVYRLIFGR